MWSTTRAYSGTIIIFECMLTICLRFVYHAVESGLLTLHEINAIYNMSANVNFRDLIFHYFGPTFLIHF